MPLAQVVRAHSGWEGQEAETGKGGAQSSVYWNMDRYPARRSLSVGTSETNIDVFTKERERDREISEWMCEREKEEISEWMWERERERAPRLLAGTTALSRLRTTSKIDGKEKRRRRYKDRESRGVFFSRTRKAFLPMPHVKTEGEINVGRPRKCCNIEWMGEREGEKSSVSNSWIIK